MKIITFYARDENAETYELGKLVDGKATTPEVEKLLDQEFTMLGGKFDSANIKHIAMLPTIFNGTLLWAIEEYSMDYGHGIVDKKHSKIIIKA